jgi:hypothetical protein
MENKIEKIDKIEEGERGRLVWYVLGVASPTPLPFKTSHLIPFSKN